MSNINPDCVSEFIAMVRKMRESQKIFFVTHKNLGECKQIERQVDAWLASEKWGKHPMSSEEEN